MLKLSHVDKDGKIRMVNITGKKDTIRRARFSGIIKIAPDTVILVKKNQIKKGDVLGAAKISGIMGAKQTDKLIPLCHNLNAEYIDIIFSVEKDYIKAESIVETTYKTGVEMEASVAVTTALLTIYDMCKAVDRSMEITDVKMLEKTGGKTLFYRTEVTGINISKTRGEAKIPVKECKLVKDFGIKNDAHAEKGSDRQVSLLSTVSIDKMKNKGLKINNGDFGENLIIKDIKIYNLPVGSLMRSFNGVVLKITKIGKECVDKCSIYKKVGDCVMPREGVFVKVIKGGFLKTGEEIIFEYKN